VTPCPLARTATRRSLTSSHRTSLGCARPPRDSPRYETGEDTGEKRIVFRTVPVFDVSMTDPLPGLDPVPLTPPAQPIEGDSDQHLIAPLHDLGRDLGYRIETRKLPDDGPGGWCDHKRQHIVVAAGPAN
jgi:hypothetical protein